jgi:hypothetical protein
LVQQTVLTLQNQICKIVDIRHQDFEQKLASVPPSIFAKPSFAIPPSLAISGNSLDASCPLSSRVDVLHILEMLGQSLPERVLVVLSDEPRADSHLPANIIAEV